MRPLTRALATTTALTGCLVLSGCGGNPTPAPPPKTSPSPTASASATPMPPALPAAAKEKTKAGAIAATRHFVEALNYSGRTGDTQSLRRAYVSLCTRCEAIADGIDTTYRQGGSYNGGDWVVDGVKFYAIDQGIAVLDTNVRYTPQVWVKRRGATPVRYRGSANHLHAFQLKWLPKDGWRVGALDPTT